MEYRFGLGLPDKYEKYGKETGNMNVLNIILSIIMYGGFLFGIILTLLFAVKARQYIKKFGIKKHVLRAVILEIALAAYFFILFILLLFTPLHSLTWNWGPVIPVPLASVICYTYNAVWMGVLPAYIVIGGIVILIGKLKRNRTALICLGIIFAAICFWGCVIGLFYYGMRQYYSVENYIAREMGGIDISEGDILYEKDDHGGFHGDGSTFIQIQFTDGEFERIEKEVSEKGNWKRFPLPSIIRDAVYGRFRGEFEAAGADIKKIRNGYWFFYDRHSESKNRDDYSEIFNRYSSNWTIAFCDTDKKMIYYMEKDT